MTGALKWLFGAIFHHFWWKLLAAVVALALWAVIASQPELESFARVPLEFRNLPEGLEISSSVVDSVYVEVRGPSAELSSMTEAKRPAVVLDMSNATPGERTFAIAGPAVVMPRNMHLVRAVPSQVRLRFEQRVSRNVPVRVRFADDAPPGYQVARYTVSPKEARITGPESHVSRVVEVVTDPVTLSSVVGSAESRVNAFVEDVYVRFQSSPQVTVTVTMKKR